MPKDRHGADPGQRVFDFTGMVKYIRMHRKLLGANAFTIV